MHGRVDLEKYAVGLKTCKNFQVQAHGGVKRRPGFVFVESVIDPGSIVRVIPFSFSTEQNYVLEFGDLYIRVIKNGAYVREAEFVITNATSTTPVVVTTDLAHGFNNGDEVYISGVVGMTEINDQIFEIAGVTTYTFQLVGTRGQAGGGMLTADLSSWVEDDLLGRIEVAAGPPAEVTMTNISRFDGGEHVSNSFGVGAFAADWRVDFTFEVTGSETYSHLGLFMLLSASPDNWSAIQASDADFVGVRFYHNSSFGRMCRLEIKQDGAQRLVDWVGPTLSTEYFFRVDRDSSVGSFGEVRMRVYPTITDRANNTNVLFNQAVVMDKVATFEYMTTAVGWLGGVDYIASGVVKEMLYSLAPADGFSGYISGGLASRLYSLVTAYPEEDIFEVKYTQSADVMTLCHPSHEIKELSRLADDNWVLNTVTIGPTVSPPTGLLCTTSGSVIYYKLTAVSLNSGEESLPTAAVGGTAVPNTLTWDDPGSGILKWNVYKRDNGTYGYIGSVDGEESPTFTEPVATIIADLTDTPPKSRNPFSGADNYPACPAYFEQRLALGGPNNAPQTMYMSQTGNYHNFNTSVPLKDDDAISFTLNALHVNRVRHLVPLNELVVLTSGGGWRVGSGTEAFTLFTMRVRPQEQRGASNVRPVIVGESIVYVQASGDLIRDLSFSSEMEGYSGSDLSILARHLFESYTIVDMAYAQSPLTTVWFVRSDGALLALTYLKEHKIWAWSQHSTDGLIESVCTVREGSEDILYAVINRTFEGVTQRFIEKISPHYFETVEDAFFVDSGLSYDVPVTITQIDSSSPVKVYATAHGFVNGDEVRITHVEGLTDLNMGYYIVFNADTNDFELIHGYGVNEVSNGNFDVDTTGWTGVDCTLASVAGGQEGSCLEITRTGGALQYANQVLGGLVLGKVYRVTAYVQSGTSGDEAFRVAALTTALATIEEITGTSSSTMTQYEFSFTATAPTDMVIVEKTTATAGTMRFDLVIVQEAEVVDGTAFPAYVSGGEVRKTVTTLSNLGHLEGRTVSILADGSVHPNKVVSSGAVTLDRAASEVHIGLPYTSEMETLDITVPPSQGSIKGNEIRIPAVTLHLYKSRGYTISGSDGDVETEMKQRFEEPYGQPTELKSGKHRIILDPNWNSHGRIKITQSDPLPLTILSIAPEVDVGG